jgi:hypothetical protein
MGSVCAAGSLLLARAGAASETTRRKRLRIFRLRFIVVLQGPLIFSVETGLSI